MARSRSGKATRHVKGQHDLDDQQRAALTSRLADVHASFEQAEQSIVLRHTCRMEQPSVIHGQPETYGLMAPYWSGYGNPRVLAVLQSLQHPTQGPAPARPLMVSGR